MRLFFYGKNQELLDEGWIYENYDWYQGECNYYKKVRYKELDASIQISFINTKEQKDAMFEAARIVKNNNPAYDNFYGSRSHILSDLIYASVLKTVGLPYDHKTNEWVKTI